MKEITYKYTNTGVFPVRYIARKNFSERSKENLNRGFKTKGISDATMKKIKTASRVLSYASEPQTVRNSKGEYIRHLCVFITLTLPFEQNHEDKVITKIVLGTFFDKCRKIGILNNYVWRAEKQINGNIHYHILSDTFVNYSLIYRLWKISLNVLGYVKKYSEKFRNMSFDEYKNLPHNKKLDLKIIVDRFAKGTRENWENPPCVKVDYCDDINQVGSYIAKYTAKDSDNKNIVEGRVWSCSSSVSDAVKKFKTDADFNKFWYCVGTEMFKREVFEGDYFSVCKFHFNSLISWFKDTFDYVKKMFIDVFKPCDYWRLSLGMQRINV